METDLGPGNMHAKPAFDDVCCEHQVQLDAPVSSPLPPGDVTLAWTWHPLDGGRMKKLSWTAAPLAG